VTNAIRSVFEEAVRLLRWMKELVAEHGEDRYNLDNRERQARARLERDACHEGAGGDTDGLPRSIPGRPRNAVHVQLDSTAEETDDSRTNINTELESLHEQPAILSRAPVVRTPNTPC